MLHTICHVISLPWKEVDALAVMHLLSQDLEIGKKVNNGKNCAFLNHVGEDPCSPHNNAMKYCDDLLNESVHIDKVMNVQSSE